MIKIAEMLPPDMQETQLWPLMEQAGVRYAVGGFYRDESLAAGEKQPWEYMPLLRLKEQYERNGFELAVIEARPPLNLTKRGLPGRDAEIDTVVELLENMGRLGIRTWCYEWMADEGPTDLLECLRAYRDVGFEGVLRPDHVPTLAGEENPRPGYAVLGRLFAVGYIRGLQESVYHDEIAAARRQGRQADR
jgi:D-mannonate dehydratase